MKKNYIKFLTFILSIILFILIIILVFFKKNQMPAKVVYMSDKYMIVDEAYDKKKGITVRGDTSLYKLDDLIRIEYHGFIFNKTIKPDKIEIIDRPIKKTNELSNNEQKIDIDNNDNKEINENTSNNEIHNESYSEDDIISYYNEGLSEGSSTFKDKFISIIDFIFYDKEIYGYRFKDLTGSAKMKILELALKLDNKLDEKSPDYKDSIGDKYKNIKEKIIARGYELKTSICSEDAYTCDNIKTTWERIKGTSKVTWSIVKDYLGIGLANLGEWYREFSGKN